MGLFTNLKVKRLIAGLADEAHAVFPDYERLLSIQREFGKIGNSAIPRIIAALRSERVPFHRGRKQAVNHGFEAIGGPYLAKVLRQSQERRSEPRSMYETYLSDVLGTLGPAAVPPLVEALKDTDYRVRWAAARALGCIGDARGARPVLDALTAIPAGTPDNIAKAFKHEVIESLTRMAGKDSEEVRGAMSLGPQLSDQAITSA